MSKTPANVSRNFAMVPEGTRRGNGDKTGRNIPETAGNMTISVSLEFLFRQREKMAARNSKSMLLTVLKAVGGEVDPMKKRLIDYGLFGKKPQTNMKQFRDKQIEQIFVWGQNMTAYEVRKIDQLMARLCKALGDENATPQNFRKSDKLQAALNEAKGWNVLVVGRYDDGFVGVDDNNDENAFINLAYVKFGTGKVPLVAAFDRPQKDGLVELEHEGQKYMDYVIDPEGSFSVTTTRGYLKDFNSSKDGAQNLRMYARGDGASFWVVQVASYTPDQLPGEFYASFQGEMLDMLRSADRISFEYGLKDGDGRLIDDILTVRNGGMDASLVFTGLIADDESRIKLYESKNDDPDLGRKRRTVTVKLIRGTFFTQKIFTASGSDL